MKINKKPERQTTTHYEYNNIIQYIEEKYGIDSRDYYGSFNKKKAQPWTGEPTKDSRPPYADFWHWVLEHNSECSNGSYIWFPGPLPFGEIKDDPKCYTKGHTPKFVMEIMKMIKDEFGDLTRERLWVSW